MSTPHWVDGESHAGGLKRLTIAYLGGWGGGGGQL